jgi:hypothetical protein
MIEIHPNLFIGNMDDAAKVVGIEGWHVIHAAKHPYHQQALGYKSQAAPKDHREYLIARRPGLTILNLVDAPNPAYIPDEIVTAALADIDANLAVGKVLINCNQGLSRAPTLGLLYLRRHTDRFANMSHEEAVAEFKGIYPDYAPAGGMDGYAKGHW